MSGSQKTDTRQKLLQSAFMEIWKQGFQAASLDEILARAEVTKGALYHHFPSKLKLGYAVVEELIRPHMTERWSFSQEESTDPIETICRLMRECQAPPEMQDVFLEYGCPLNNLAQEMSPIDEGFRHRIDQIFSEWKRLLSTALQGGQVQGTVRENVDTVRAATFVVAVVEGAIGMAKNAKDPEILEICHEGLEHYLMGLRPGTFS